MSRTSDARKRLALVGLVSGPISPPIVRRYDPAFIPAYVSNGLIGLRVGKIPQLEGLAIVGGLAAVHPVDKVEGFARAPYPLSGDVAVNGKQMSDQPDRVRFISQEYDFSCGELRTRLAFATPDATATIEVVTFCSRTLPCVVLQETRVTVDRACDLAIAAKVDHTGIDGTLAKREVNAPGTEKVVIDGTLLWETHGGLSRCGIAYVTDLVTTADVDTTRNEQSETAPLSTTYRLRARAGRAYALHQYAALIPSDLHSEPQLQAGRMSSMAAQIGFDAARKHNRAAWADLWKGRVVLVGADRRWQELADAAFYYLHSSAHPSSLFSTSMFGLAYWPNYHYYRGQVMWDIEGFVFLPMLLTDPHAAEALLAYRSEHLAAAERNAAMNGYRGLQFPWASTPLHGEEGIRTDAPMVFFEQHVSLSVALAFARYVHATGDLDFLREHAWPVLEGVATWIESRWGRTRRGYEIKRTLGIDEQREHPVDNPGYVNMAASVVLGEAAAAGRRLDRGDAPKWARMAKAMYIPTDTRRRVIKNTDTFTARASGRGSATPEVLYGLFPVGYPLDERTERETIHFYLDRVDPYVGSPMLSPLLGTYAARIGDRRRSLRLFQEGYAEFINPPFTETDEFSRTRFPEKPRVGPFQANLAAFLTACMFGLTGVAVGPGDPATWPARPVVMPAGWDGVEIERLLVRGKPARLVARHGDKRARLVR
jgi:trehalose/maltose hydrolase-like predicted phosphorylase